MLTSHDSRSVCLALGVLILVLVATPLVGSAQDYPQPDCFSRFSDCFVGAAYIDAFWHRLWTALDCELGLVGCVRIAVFGL